MDIWNESGSDLMKIQASYVVLHFNPGLSIGTYSKFWVDRSHLLDLSGYFYFYKIKGTQSRMLATLYEGWL